MAINFSGPRLAPDDGAQNVPGSGGGTSFESESSAVLETARVEHFRELVHDLGRQGRTSPHSEIVHGGPVAVEAIIQYLTTNENPCGNGVRGPRIVKVLSGMGRQVVPVLVKRMKEGTTEGWMGIGEALFLLEEHGRPALQKGIEKEDDATRRRVLNVLFDVRSAFFNATPSIMAGSFTNTTILEALVDTEWFDSHPLRSEISRRFPRIQKTLAARGKLSILPDFLGVLERRDIDAKGAKHLALPLCTLGSDTLLSLVESSRNSVPLVRQRAARVLCAVINHCHGPSGRDAQILLGQLQDPHRKAFEVLTFLKEVYEELEGPDTDVIRKSIILSLTPVDPEMASGDWKQSVERKDPSLVGMMYEALANSIGNIQILIDELFQSSQSEARFEGLLSRIRKMDPAIVTPLIVRRLGDDEREVVLNAAAALRTLPKSSQVLSVLLEQHFKAPPPRDIE